MIKRIIQKQVEAALARQAAVALIGPRQVGKTTLALQIAATRPAIYLDLERLKTGPNWPIRNSTSRNMRMNW